MENFTADSLKQFISGTPPKDQGQVDPMGEARTSRGKQVMNIMRGQEGEAQQNQGSQKQQESLDSLIRQSMGELVRKHMQTGKLQELKSTLEEHKNFIDDILSLLESSAKKK